MICRIDRIIGIRCYPEGICNHTSILVPNHLTSNKPSVLTCKLGSYWSLVSPKDIISLDLETLEILADCHNDISDVKSIVYETTASNIYRGLTRKRSDIKCSVDTDMHCITTLSRLEAPFNRILSIHQTRCRFIERKDSSIEDTVCGVVYDSKCDGVADENKERDYMSIIWIRKRPTTRIVMRQAKQNKSNNTKQKQIEK